MRVEPRVALVTPEIARQGGVERMVEIAAKALTARNVPVTVFTSGGAAGASIDLDPAMFAQARDILPKRGHRAAVATLASKLVACADIVDLHRAASISLMRQLAGKTATLLSIHSPEMTCPAGTRYLPRSNMLCSRAPGLGCWATDRREGCLCLGDGKSFGWKSRVRALFLPKLTRAAMQLASCIVFNSEATKLQFVEFFGEPPCSRVIPEPLGSFQSAAVKRRPKSLAFVSRLVGVKGGHDVLLATAAIEGATLDIYGDGPEKHSLEVSARAMGIGNRVTFHGWSSQEAIMRGLAQSQCLLVPSRWFEAWGMVGPEAISQGCPVVAYDSGGMSQWCLPQFGTIVPRGNVDAITVAAKDWLARMEGGLDTSIWRAEAQRRWGVERYVDQYLEAADAAMNAFKRSLA